VSVETFWQPLGASVFGSDAAGSSPFAVLATLSGVAVLAGSFGVLRWGDRFPGGSAALAGFSLLVRGAAILVLANAVSAAGVGFGLTITYLALATNNVPHDTLLHKAVPGSRRSSMLSVHSLVFFLGIAVASGPLGWLASKAGPGAALTIAGLITMLACTAYAIIGRLEARATPLTTPMATDHTTEHTAELAAKALVADALLTDVILNEGPAD